VNTMRVIPALFLAMFAGCGGSKHSTADIERGRTALAAALDAWKNNDPSERLRTLPDPVEFTDEMRLSNKLLDFTLGKPNATDPDVIRYTVTLKLQDRKGKAHDRDVVFEVKLKTPIVIARDPYE
jgi:hypothetical protein